MWRSDLVVAWTSLRVVEAIPRTRRIWRIAPTGARAPLATRRDFLETAAQDAHLGIPERQSQGNVRPGALSEEPSSLAKLPVRARPSPFVPVFNLLKRPERRSPRQFSASSASSALSSSDSPYNTMSPPGSFF